MNKKLIALNRFNAQSKEQWRVGFDKCITCIPKKSVCCKCTQNYILMPTNNLHQMNEYYNRLIMLPSSNNGDIPSFLLIL